MDMAKQGLEPACLMPRRTPLKGVTGVRFSYSPLKDRQHGRKRTDSIPPRRCRTGTAGTGFLHKGVETILVISRKEKQSVQIDEKTTVTVNAIKGNTVTLGFEAPRDVRIVRGELLTDASRNKEWERQ